VTGVLAAEVRRLREENERLRKDAERLDWISEEYAHLQPFGIPTGEGDYDTGWRVLQEHCCRPSPQTIAEVYSDSVRDVIDAARGAK
jgi:hypothetical protein